MVGHDDDKAEGRVRSERDQSQKNVPSKRIAHHRAGITGVGT